MREKKRKNNKTLLIEIFLSVLTLLLIWFAKQEILITILALVLVILCFFLEYHKGEWTLFFIGVLIGILVEIGGSIMYKLQYWQEGSFFGIPFWLPVFYGYGAVFIRRIGKFIVKD